jgi:hypothetical protein
MLANADVTQKDDKLQVTHIFQNNVWLKKYDVAIYWHLGPDSLH